MNRLIRQKRLIFAVISGRALLLALLVLFSAAAAPAVVLSALPVRDVRLPVLMYHSILRDPARTGKYVCTPASLDADMAALAANGYETVTVDDLLAYTRGGTLPEKPVMLTFDDGHLNNLTYLPALLEKHGMRAVVFAVGEYSEKYAAAPDPNPNYAYMSWAELRALESTGLCEVQSHSYSLHSIGARPGAAAMRGESETAYARALTADSVKMLSALAEKSGVRADAFAYPFGLFSKSSDRILQNAGFSATFTCEEHVNRITREPASLFSLGRFNRSGFNSTAEMMRKIG